MKRLILIMFSAVLAVSAYAQKCCGKCCEGKGYYTRYVADKSLKADAKAWAERGEWRNGFTKGTYDSSVNLVEFYEQYQHNPELWKKVFNWLEETDLTAIPKGKHNIPGTDLVASVEDSQNDPIEKRKTESHYDNADFMFVVSGTEGFRILDHYTSKPNTEYKPDVIRYSYEPEKLKTLEVSKGKFVIFFPSDWHIAKVQTGLQDQAIRVIVIKMPYDWGQYNKHFD